MAVTLDLQLPAERAVYLAHAWWSLPDLLATGEMIFPERLPESAWRHCVEGRPIAGLVIL